MEGSTLLRRVLLDGRGLVRRLFQSAVLRVRAEGVQEGLLNWQHRMHEEGSGRRTLSCPTSLMSDSQRFQGTDGARPLRGNF